MQIGDNEGFQNGFRQRSIPSGIAAISACSLIALES
jgi:hypothetical protein